MNPYSTWKRPAEAGGRDYISYIQHAGKLDTMVDGSNWSVPDGYDDDGQPLRRAVPIDTPCVIDWLTMQEGWMKVSKAGVEEHLVLFGEPLPPKPADSEFRYGMKVLMLLPPEFGLRFWGTNTAGATDAIGALSNAYMRAPEAARGMLPTYLLKLSQKYYSKKRAEWYCNPRIILMPDGWLLERPGNFGEALLKPPMSDIREQLIDGRESTPETVSVSPVEEDAIPF